MSETIAVADIGGTHARFALAKIAAGRVESLAKPITFKTAEHASFRTAWEEFARQAGQPLPTSLGIAFAGPVGGDLLKLTNNPWVIRPAQFADELGIERVAIVNDFGAVGHAVAQLGPEQFDHVCGPPGPLPVEGVTTIVGPGTGLGVAQLLRHRGSYEVIGTEGGHIDFAPLDELDDRMLAYLRRGFRRVSIERIVAGGGLANIYAALAAIEGQSVPQRDDKQLWALALDGSDSLAAAALDRFCLSLGAIAGDLALAQGANAVVIAGGLGLRIKNQLPKSAFSERFIAKGRFERRMQAIPVKLLTYANPGLYGVAAAFAKELA